MRIDAIIAHRARIPLRVRFSHALATRTESCSVIAEVRTSGGARGYGEGAPRPYVTGEDLGSAAAALEQAAPALIGAVVEEAADIERFPALAALPPSACCALELALLDALGQTLGQSLVRLLGPPRRRDFTYSGVVEATNGEALDRLLERIKPFGLQQIKLKLTRDEAADRARIRRARAALGGAVELRADANGCWDAEEARRRVPALIDEGIQSVEQPMPAFLREAYPALCCEFGREIGVMVDEGVCSLEDAEWMIARGGATAFNLKVGKHGGLLGALRVHALAEAHGIACQLGAFVGETSILSAAGRVLAGLAGGLTAHEGSAGAHLLEHDVVATPLGFGEGGRASLADVEGSGGLGIEVDPALVARAIETAHVGTS